MNQQAVTTKKVIVIKDDQRTPVGDLVVLETPLTIFLNGKIDNPYNAPEKLDCLALGFLFRRA